MQTETIVAKAMDDATLSAEEIAALFETPLFSPESALVIAASRRKSRQAGAGEAEIHAQIGLNIASCPKNCKFCSFAACNKVFSVATELTTEQVATRAAQFERDGANAIVLMGTADYPLEGVLKTAREVRQRISPETVLVANVGDFTAAEARQIKEAGFDGIYHALRLGEGRDTRLDPAQRVRTLRIARDAGLVVGTCLEPVGAEHTTAELVEKTLVTREARPCYSGAARRIPIPGTALAAHGQTSEARMAHILAVVRLVLPLEVPGNCTHEPNVIGAAAGANLMWAEAGSNPRDTLAETEQQRGMTVQDIRRIFQEAEWVCTDGPSRFYRPDSASRPLATNDPPV